MGRRTSRGFGLITLTRPDTCLDARSRFTVVLANIAGHRSCASELRERRPCSWTNYIRNFTLIIMYSLCRLTDIPTLRASVWLSTNYVQPRIKGAFHRPNFERVSLRGPQIDGITYLA